MKAPDLARHEDAGLREWHGAADPVKEAALAAGLHYHAADLKGLQSKSELMQRLGAALGLPEHFGNNWDALADCLEDDEWFGKHGVALVLKHTTDYSNHHANDWSMLREILEEAAEYWRERHKSFWTFVA